MAEGKGRTGSAVGRKPRSGRRGSGEEAGGWKAARRQQAAVGRGRQSDLQSADDMQPRRLWCLDTSRAAETVPAKHPPRRHAFHAPESRTGVADAPNLATPAPVTCLPCRYRRGRRGRCFAGKVGDNLPKGSHFFGNFPGIPENSRNLPLFFISLQKYSCYD